MSLTILKTIWLEVTGGFKNLWTVLEPIIANEAKTSLEALIPIATQVVQQVETTGGLPNAKRDAALAAIKTQAESAGLSVATSVCNLAIELAVQNLAPAAQSQTGN